MKVEDSFGSFGRFVSFSRVKWSTVNADIHVCELELASLLISSFHSKVWALSPNRWTVEALYRIEVSYYSKVFLLLGTTLILEMLNFRCRYTMSKRGSVHGGTLIICPADWLCCAVCGLC